MKVKLLIVLILGATGIFGRASSSESRLGLYTVEDYVAAAKAYLHQNEKSNRPGEATVLFVSLVAGLPPTVHALKTWNAEELGANVIVDESDGDSSFRANLGQLPPQPRDKPGSARLVGYLSFRIPTKLKPEGGSVHGVFLEGQVNHAMRPRNMWCAAGSSTKIDGVVMGAALILVRG